MRALLALQVLAPTVIVGLSACCMFEPMDEGGCGNEDELQDASAEVALVRPIPAHAGRPGAIEQAGQPGGSAGLVSSVILGSSAEELYGRALEQEETERYPAAIRSYEEVLALDPDHPDAKQRRDTLAALVELAEESYATAIGTADFTEARAYLELIRTFWPSYRDVEVRLASLPAGTR